MTEVACPKVFSHRRSPCADESVERTPPFVDDMLDQWLDVTEGQAFDSPPDGPSWTPRTGGVFGLGLSHRQDDDRGKERLELCKVARVLGDDDAIAERCRGHHHGVDGQGAMHAFAFR